MIVNSYLRIDYQQNNFPCSGVRKSNRNRLINQMHKDINKNLYTNFQLLNVAMDNGLLTMDYLTIQIKHKKSRL